MCMQGLDNTGRNGQFWLANANKLAGIALAGLVLTGVGSCRKSAPPATESASVRPIGDVTAEADRLYGGREDLTKVRQALVALRQGQAAEPGSYELAWRLAKFNYYLGAHSADETEREKAYRDGIAAGRLAVKLQDGKPDGHFWLGEAVTPTFWVAMLLVAAGVIMGQLSFEKGAVPQPLAQAEV